LGLQVERSTVYYSHTLVVESTAVRGMHVHASAQAYCPMMDPTAAYLPKCMQRAPMLEANLSPRKDQVRACARCASRCMHSRARVCTVCVCAVCTCVFCLGTSVKYSSRYLGIVGDCAHNLSLRRPVCFGVLGAFAGFHSCSLRPLHRYRQQASAHRRGVQALPFPKRRLCAGRWLGHFTCTN